MSRRAHILVIAWLDPAIYRAKRTCELLMDARVILREDGASRLLPAHDELEMGRPP
jgi:hypothetical protein